ncbi:MAG: hypothetical protein HY910_06765 [Desulfarculus sp.]|nr:hypothetical protein [Desulfarculus sp.]
MPKAKKLTTKPQTLEQLHRALLNKANIKPNNEPDYFTMPTVLRDVPSTAANNVADVALFMQNSHQ